MAQFSLLIIVLCALLMYPSGTDAAEREDTFDKLDALLEAQFQDLDAELEQQFQLLDEALEASYKQLEAEVGETWGQDEVELPTKTSWVDYTEDKSLRRKIDFEKGIVQIEQILDQSSEIDQVVAKMQSAASELTSDSMSDLSNKDTVLKDTRARLQAQDIELVPFKAKDDQPILGSVVGNMPDASRIDQMVRLAVGAAGTADVDIPDNNSGSTARVSKLANKKQKVTIEVPLRTGYQTSLASRYRQSILEEAERQNIPASLVFAVMETESSFNPRARSPVPAFGLMQLVPRSGAMDAYQHVYGEKLLLDPEYLFDAGQNVELGTAYLNLLDTRYLRHVKNPLSRQYCVIAAYNTGAGNVARSFSGSTNVRKAAETINAMTPDQVYGHLVENLPYEETRRYLKKVTRAKQKYSSLDQLAIVSIRTDD